MQLVKTSILETSKDLDLDSKLVEAYYHNFYINRTSPIRDLTQREIAFAKFESQFKYYAETDLMTLCLQYDLEYKDFQREKLEKN